MGKCISKPINEDEFDDKLFTYEIKIIKDISNYINFGKPIYYQSKEITKLKGSLKNSEIPIIIKKLSKTEKNLKNFKAEVYALKKIDHPNIIKLMDFFQTDTHYFCIYQYFDGEALLDYIVKNPEIISEIMIRSIIEDLLQVINQMHYLHHISHREILPKHILFNGKDVLLSGLSSSRVFYPKKINSFKSSRLNTSFSSPEVLRGEYNEKADIWNLGLILLIILTGSNPFEDKSEEQTKNKIITKIISLEDLTQKRYSIYLLNVLRLMLEKDPEKRPSARLLLKQEWFMLEEIKIQNKNWEMFSDSLKQFQKRNKFLDHIKKLYIEKMMLLEEKSEIIETFKIFDINNEGILSLREFKLATQRTFLGLSDKDIDYLFIHLDSNRNGVVEYSEFVHGVMQKKLLMQKERITEFIDFCDFENKGFFTKEEFFQIVGENNEYFEKKMDGYFVDGIITKVNFVEFIFDCINKEKQIS